MRFISNNNIDGTCLIWGWIHLNQNEAALLIKNFSKVVNSVWYRNERDSEVYDNSNESTIKISNKGHLGNIRLKK